MEYLSHCGLVTFGKEDEWNTREGESDTNSVQKPAHLRFSFLLKTLFREVPGKNSSALKRAHWSRSTLNPDAPFCLGPSPGVKTQALLIQQELIWDATLDQMQGKAQSPQRFK